MNDSRTARHRLLHANDRDGEYPPSWYAASADQLAPFAPLAGEASCDVAVIGAGYSGLSCALHLAGRGYDVVVLEAQRVGWGASGRNGGQVGTGQRLEQDELEQKVGETLARAAWDIAAEAKALVKSLVATHGIGCDLKPGALHANHRARFDRHSEAYAAFLQERYDYHAIRYVPPSQMRDMLGSSDYSGGTLDTDAAHLHPLNYALGLARAAQAAGVRIHERSEVVSVSPGATVRVRTAGPAGADGGVLRARHVVYACNGYLDGLEGEVAARVMPINNFIIATEPLGEERARSLIRDDVCVADSRFVINYYRLTADRRLLFGGGETYGYRFPADIAGFVRRPMLKVYPQLADVRIDYGWGGTLAITLSRLPHFARLDGNRLSISGYSGSGVALATGAGALAAEAIDGVASRFDVMHRLPTPSFPGGQWLRSPLLALAMTWYALRDRL